MTTGSYLDKIIPRTKLDLDSRRSLVPESELINKIKDLPSTIDFYQAFRKAKLHLIAEINPDPNFCTFNNLFFFRSFSNSF